MPSKQKPLWTCPKCGNKFVTKNMWHSCGKYNLDDLFASSEPHVRKIFDKIVELIKVLGSFTVIPQKTRVTLQVRVRFLSIMIRKSHLICGFWFAKTHKSPRFHKIEEIAPKAISHEVRIESLDDFDEEFKSWLKESYAIGKQKHLA